MARARPYPMSCESPILLGDLLLWEHRSYYQPSSTRTGLCSTTLQWVTLDGRWCVGKWWRGEHSAIDGQPFGYAVVLLPRAGGRRTGGEEWATDVDPEWVEERLRAAGYSITSLSTPAT